jgi:FkbM family methyltransferase
MTHKLSGLRNLLEDDIKFFQLAFIPTSVKLDFFFKKYYLIFKSKILKSDNYQVKLFDRLLAFDNPFGASFLQKVYIDNAFLKNYIPEHAVIIDVGANIGQFNIFCTNYLLAKRVYSFEPLKETYDKLIVNVNSKDCYNFAISTKKSLRLYIPGTTLMASSYPRNRDNLSEEVSTVKLDDIDRIKNERQIDLLKIDTEGSEYDVLISSGEILNKTKYLLIEASVARPSEGTIVDIISLLKSKLRNIKLIDVGYIYHLEQKVDSIDLLFQCV